MLEGHNIICSVGSELVMKGYYGPGNIAPLPYVQPSTSDSTSFEVISEVSWSHLIPFLRDIGLSSGTWPRGLTSKVGMDVVHVHYSSFRRWTRVKGDDVCTIAGSNIDHTPEYARRCTHSSVKVIHGLHIFEEARWPIFNSVQPWRVLKRLAVKTAAPRNWLCWVQFTGMEWEQKQVLRDHSNKDGYSCLDE